MALKSAKNTSVKKAAKKKAAPRRTCGTMQAHFRLLEQDPNFRQRQFSLQQFTAQQMTLAGVAAAAKAGPTVIPVVVHVVYNKAAENISDAQIKS